uniref:Uncharacterized protein n=1 Tax=Sphaerodactylus townsendi TaxID=933632 RepID=A0ACB8G6W9_9SAUR
MQGGSWNDPFSQWHPVAKIMPFVTGVQDVSMLEVGKSQGASPHARRGPGNSVAHATLKRFRLLSLSVCSYGACLRNCPNNFDLGISCLALHHLAKNQACLSPSLSCCKPPSSLFHWAFCVIMSQHSLYAGLFCCKSRHWISSPPSAGMLLSPFRSTPFPRSRDQEAGWRTRHPLFGSSARIGEYVSVLFNTHAFSCLGWGGRGGISFPPTLLFLKYFSFRRGEGQDRSFIF